MIFDEILIKNFGVYRDTQSVSLLPPSPEKPVILFGGLNGVGKTTLLDALQLVLYGKSARCSNRGSLPYDEFLRRSIHRTADPKDGARLEVQFYHTSDGRKHTYRINRSWSLNGSGVRENVEVARDGVLDRVLTESWTEYVESFIPLRISNLFFFDGEKIEGLADLENSTEVLSTAIRSLLGLDIVDRLLTDLVVLERRKRETLKNDIERQRINELKEEIQRLEQRREDLFIERGATQNDVDYKTKLLNEVEDEFRLQGGELFERQKMLEDERATLVNHLKESEEELRDIASGPTPMILIGSLLNEIDHQSDSEEEAAQAEILGSILAERDNQILKEAQKHKAHKQVLDAIKKFLINDRNQRIKASAADRYLNLKAEDRKLLRDLQKSILLDTQKKVRQIIRRTDELQTLLVDLDRKLASIPKEEAIAHVIEKRERARLVLEEARGRLATLDVDLERVKREQEQRNAQLVGQIEKTIELDFEQEDLSRTIFHSQRTRQSLEKFRTAVTRRHVNRIEQLVFDSLKRLLRKESLISDLRIDPERFSIELRGKNGKSLSPDRLSAGERQLLAVSLLWGLARAAGRPLPAIIDTPLGRLDASHRDYLVERYFPQASHQVLLLSTDEEINKKYYEKLKPWVGHTYSLKFDDATSATHIEPGYFW